MKFCCLIIYAFLLSCSQKTKDSEINILRVGEFGYKLAEKDKRYGFVDSTDAIVIPFQFQGADVFREGLALVYKDNCAGFIDRAGKVIIPLVFDTALPFF